MSTDHSDMAIEQLIQQELEALGSVRQSFELPYFQPDSDLSENESDMDSVDGDAHEQELESDISVTTQRKKVPLMNFVLIDRWLLFILTNEIRYHDYLRTYSQPRSDILSMVISAGKEFQGVLKESTQATKQSKLLMEINDFELIQAASTSHDEEPIGNHDRQILEHSQIVLRYQLISFHLQSN